MLTKIKPSLLPVLNGLVGDKLAAQKSGWAIEMSFRLGGKDVAPNKLNKKLKGQRILVFVHGLMADELIWKELGPRVEKKIPCLYVRYNTGLHISTNGQNLAELLEDLYARLSPKELVLAGHSMGGLVIRSASHFASQKRFRWTKTVKKIFLLAVPNEGAALEKLGHATTIILKKIAWFQLGLIGNILDQRSDGIKDLRLGSMLEEDWNDEKKKFVDQSTRASVPGLPGVVYYILVANMMRDDKSLMAKYFGDGLVTMESAMSKTLLHVSEVKIFSSTGHNSLMKSKEVADHIIATLCLS